MCAETVIAGIFKPTVIPRAPTRFIEEVWPSIFERGVRLSALSYHLGGVRFDEIVLLASIIAHLQPRRLFEIGTCFGRTTINLAQNTQALEVVFTLNLPPDVSEPPGGIEQDRLLYNHSRSKIGERWRMSPYTANITQLFGDSAQFDFSSYRDMDFVFIDGSKSESHVLSDSENGWKMLRPGGLSVWHDYGYCDGVTSAVDQFAEKVGVDVTQIYKTTLAVARK